MELATEKLLTITNENSASIHVGLIICKHKRKNVSDKGNHMRVIKHQLQGKFNKTWFNDNVSIRNKFKENKDSRCFVTIN